jgi:hypothetical protein
MSLALLAAIVVALVVMVRRSRKHRAEVEALRADVDALRSGDPA